MWRGLYFPREQGSVCRIDSNMELDLPTGQTWTIVAGFCDGTSQTWQLNGPCPADLDGDGGVGATDLTLMLRWLELGDARADIDDGSRLGRPDGGVDINDLLYFLYHSEQGC